MIDFYFCDDNPSKFVYKPKEILSSFLKKADTSYTIQYITIANNQLVLDMKANKTLDQKKFRINNFLILDDDWSYYPEDGKRAVIDRIIEEKRKAFVVLYSANNTHEVVVESLQKLSTQYSNEPGIMIYKHPITYLHSGPGTRFLCKIISNLVQEANEFFERGSANE